MKVILETERLVLAEVDFEDKQFIFELVNAPSWIKYIGDRDIKNLQDAEAYIQKSFIVSYQKHGYGLYKVILKASNQPIGLCGLVNRPTLKHIDIGFALLAAYEKKGYGYEAAKATLDYAQDVLLLFPVLAITAKDNFSSQALLRKIGLSKIDSVKFDKEEEELLLFST